jgi:hypothetical protein
MSSNIPTNGFNNYINTLKIICSLVASIGVVIPGIGYFTNLTPPLFYEIGWITSFIAGFVAIVIYYYDPKRRKKQKSLPFLIKRAILLLTLSVGLIIGYSILFSLCTVTIVGSNKKIQIGFGKYEWSLTDYGKEKKRTDPLSTPDQWIMEETFYKGVAFACWKPWTIYLSGIAMIAIFLFMFIFWTWGWCLIAKQLAIDSRRGGLSGRRF